MTRIVSLPLALFTLGVSGCAGSFDPAHFEGSREARRAEPEALLEVASRSSELQTVGHVHASCTLHPGFRRVDDELLSDLDCSTERLIWALRESAASAGGDALVGKHCNSRRIGDNARETYRVACAADVARFAGDGPSRRPLSAPRSVAATEPAPSASDVQRIEQPDASLAFRVSVSFAPRVPRFEHRVLSFAEVSELASMPAVDRPLGDLIASCEDGCDERALRRGVLVAAGRLGAPDVVAVRCFGSASGNSCVGTLAAPERPE